MTTRTDRLLLAEEDEVCRNYLAHNLTADGYAVDIADSRDAAVAQLKEHSIDLLLVDVNGKTLALVDWLRAADPALIACASDTPIVVLSSHPDELGLIRLLDRGADDVIAKPFSYPELRARLATVLRRTGPRQPAPVTVAGPVKINHHDRTVTVDGRPVSLSGTEYRLLCQLASEPTRVFTRDELLRDVWGFGCAAHTRTLDSHAHRLRKRLGECGQDLVVNRWGVGYGLLASAA